METNVKVNIFFSILATLATVLLWWIITPIGKSVFSSATEAIVYIVVVFVCNLVLQSLID